MHRLSKDTPRISGGLGFQTLQELKLDLQEVTFVSSTISSARVPMVATLARFSARCFEDPLYEAVNAKEKAKVAAMSRSVFAGPVAEHSPMHEVGDCQRRRQRWVGVVGNEPSY